MIICSQVVLISDIYVSLPTFETMFLWNKLSISAERANEVSLCYSIWFK